MQCRRQRNFQPSLLGIFFGSTTKPLQFSKLAAKIPWKFNAVPTNQVPPSAFRLCQSGALVASSIRVEATSVTPASQRIDCISLGISFNLKLQLEEEYVDRIMTGEADACFERVRQEILCCAADLYRKNTPSRADFH
ncbi:Fanconi anemia group J protein [Trichinella spiralis]|uniref:Fanconi anemia group J protein n=1 Tax=Trichinella spiralis TaxID=6334 RepID=A0ABR3KW03_TRISP